MTRAAHSIYKYEGVTKPELVVMDALMELEARQDRILQRIAALEVALETRRIPDAAITSGDAGGAGVEGSVESRLSAILRSRGVRDFAFKRVPADYYDSPIEVRKDILGASSVEHLCKSIVMVNTQAPSNITDCSNRNYSKYYVIVIQYTARLNAENIKNFLYALNDGKISKKKFNMRLAPEEESQKLTGFVHNAVTCIGMQTDIPVILDEAITKLRPDFFWLGGGEVDLKLGIRTPQFISCVDPFVVNCSA